VRVWHQLLVSKPESPTTRPSVGSCVHPQVHSILARRSSVLFLEGFKRPILFLAGLLPVFWAVSYSITKSRKNLFGQGEDHDSATILVGITTDYNRSQHSHNCCGRVVRSHNCRNPLETADKWVCKLGSFTVTLFRNT
jgi:hypothetical protein